MKISGAPTQCCKTLINCHDFQRVSHSRSIDYKLGSANSLPQFRERSRVYNWYRTMNCAEKDVPQNMLSTLISHGVKLKTLV